MIHEPGRRRSLARSLLALLLWLGVSPVQASAEIAEHRRLAEAYAPVVFQESRSAVLDFITRFDFDGDWNGDNNWRNAYLFDLPGYVYYGIIESTSHYFITYAFYHPRDYTSQRYEGFAPKIEHENDLEGCTLVVEKDGTELGRLVLMETLAHDVFHTYDHPDRQAPRTRTRGLDGPMTLIEGRPAIYIEPEGHGVRAADARTVGSRFPGITYRYTGHAAVPHSHRDPHATYDLLSLEDSLWARRFDIGTTFCCADPYHMTGGATVHLGSALNGPIGGCAAKPPWGWDEADDALAKGDWFRDPLRTYLSWLGPAGASSTYLHNPYLESVGQPVEPACSESGSQRTVRGALRSSLLGIARALMLGGFSRSDIGQQARRLFLSDAVLLEWSSHDELTRWTWDATAAVLPAIVGDGLRAELHVPSQGPFSLDSPEFNAPARYFDTVVLAYASSRHGARGRVAWTYDEATDFTDEHSAVIELPRTERAGYVPVSLDQSPGWDPTSTVRRVRISIEPLSGQPAAPAQGDADPPVDDMPFILRYVVFDRHAFSDTFER